MNAGTAAGLFVIGIGAGVLGSLLGLGGGFIVIPLLRLFFGLAPAVTAGISLVMVGVNSLSGAIAYYRQGRIDFRMGLFCVATAIPASLLGTYLVHFVSPAGFDLLYGAFLVTVAIDAIRKRNRTGPPKPSRVGGRQTVLTDRQGLTFRYAMPTAPLLGVGGVVGFFSTFFGIGGGAVFVPVLALTYGIPAHIVTATSTFVIVMSAPIGIVSHQLSGGIDWAYAIPLSIGGIVGGQFGPRIARRLSSPQLMLVLAGVMIFAAITLAVRHLF